MTNKETQPKIESVETVPQSKVTPSAKEIVGSLELAVDFLENSDPDRLQSTVWVVERQFVDESQAEVEDLVKEKRTLYVELIQGGIDGYLKKQAEIVQNLELSDKEREKQLQDLKYAFFRAKQINQMVRAQAIQNILENLSNPYGDDVLFKQYANCSAESSDIVCKSEWNPEEHYIKKLASFFSENDIQNIQRFIEGCAKQRHKINMLSLKVEDMLDRPINIKSYDPGAAKIILKDVFKKEYSLGPYTKVVVGKSAVTIILSDTDYDLVATSRENSKDKDLKSSGGLHFPGTILNLARDSYRTSKVIAHEDEHAVFDVLGDLHQTDLVEEGKYVISGFDSHFKYEDSTLRDIIFKHFVKEIVEISLGDTFFMSRFADELLANKLGNKDRTDEDILEVLNEGKTYDYLNVNDYNLGKLLVTISKKLDECTTTMFEQKDSLSPQIKEYLIRDMPVYLEDIIEDHVNKKKIYAMRKNAVRQINRLSEEKYSPERIRSLLTTNNIASWESIVDTVLDKVKVTDFDEERGQFKKEMRDRAAKKLAPARMSVGRLYRRFKNISEEKLPVEESVNFTEVEDLADKFLADGYKIVKTGFDHNDDFTIKSYKCSLRKIQDNAIHVIEIEKYFISGEPSFVDVRFYIDSENRNSEALVTFNLDEEKIDIKKIQEAIEEARKEVGVKGS